jgi:hypothetical protein
MTTDETPRKPLRRSLAPFLENNMAHIVQMFTRQTQIDELAIMMEIDTETLKQSILEQYNDLKNNKKTFSRLFNILLKQTEQIKKQGPLFHPTTKRLIEIEAVSENLEFDFIIQRIITRLYPLYESQVLRSLETQYELLNEGKIDEFKKEYYALSALLNDEELFGKKTLGNLITHFLADYHLFEPFRDDDKLFDPLLNDTDFSELSDLKQKSKTILQICSETLAKKKTPIAVIFAALALAISFIVFQPKTTQKPTPTRSNKEQVSTEQITPKSTTINEANPEVKAEIRTLLAIAKTSLKHYEKALFALTKTKDEKKIGELRNRIFLVKTKLERTLKSLNALPNSLEKDKAIDSIKKMLVVVNHGLGIIE